MSNVPKLRFNEFSGEWKEKLLNQVSKINPKSDNLPCEFVYIDLESVEKGLLIKQNKILKVEAPSRAQRLLSNNDILFQTVRPYQKNNYYFNLGDDYVASTGYAQIRAKESSHFLYQKLHTDNFVNKVLLRCTGTSYPAINSTDLSKIKISIPSKQEQEKIASFLTSIDTKIEQLTKKEKLLQQYKKGVMQKIFNQEIRFKADDGSEFCEWEEKKLGDIFKRITTKNKEDNQNVLTISAQHGLINQEKFFNKSVSAKDVTGYYLLKKGDFAYNKSYSKGYPMGAIKKLNNYDKGVVSTLYICFRINSGYDSSFYEKYFDSGFLNKELHKIAQEGARNHGLLNMSVVEFFNDIKMPVPSIEEQNKIANFLSSIDSKIEQTQKQLESSKEFKKALLQQMFV
ncbi:restriction endonuclease subunit S [Aliarcobacter butzleri]|uniref:restriction endonuclease subunit S n=1 Tax=Aliarcobacter butzleri TaxID=28197 RepID=UPI00125EBD3E|nr:restriction endonuclease subunit S [Aliarcobacter butzleri]MCG3704333.1 restriction endonuclease subunit S [Aliarcobacter butzleri]